MFVVFKNNYDRLFGNAFDDTCIVFTSFLISDET